MGRDVCRLDGNQIREYLLPKVAMADEDAVPAGVPLDQGRQVLHLRPEHNRHLRRRPVGPIHAIILRHLGPRDHRESDTSCRIGQ